MPSFGAKATEQIPEKLRPAPELVVKEIESLTDRIGEYDKKVAELDKQHAETERLRPITGVGAVTALAFVRILGGPKRFPKSRDVGAYLGLCSKREQSGKIDPELRISKSGDRLMRRLLVQAARYILGHYGPECDLRTWGLALAARGKKNAKKRAVVAVARTLSVVMHRLWVTGEPYDPLRTTTALGARRKTKKSA